MNGPSSSLPETAAGDKRAGGRAAETRPLYWSVQRELWENRSIYIAPLAVTAFVLLGSLISVVRMRGKIESHPAQDPAELLAMALRPFSMAPAPIMLASFIVGLFYCLDALYGERRDRSILFWKSLPVSDLTTGFSKIFVPLVVLPLIAFVLSVITQIIMLAVSVPVLLNSAVSPCALWTELRFFQGLLIMVYGLTVHALWFAPIYTGLLLISAWARRAPFLWAVLPLFALAAVERIALSSSWFSSMLRYRVLGAMKTAFTFEPGSEGDVNRLSQLTPVEFLSSAGLWVGLAFAAVFLAAAIRLRRHREPI
ncbi:MAG TPA: ABC transporter permease [Thermoanaerobaculia bacterium]|nr:ABC transporter permease [Thermoanaerobaculia bacterium]